MQLNSSLYMAAAALYATQAVDALATGHGFIVYLGLAIVHGAMALVKALHH